MRHRQLSVGWSLRIGVGAAVFVTFSATTPGYASSRSLYSILDGAALVGLVATGLSLTMLVGELDLSVGSVAACGATVGFRLLPSLGLVPSLVVAFAAGAMFGLVQGVVIAQLRINSLVFTLATMIGLRGLTGILTSEATLNLPLKDINASLDVSQRILWLFSPGSMTLLAALVSVGLFLRYHPYGREMFAAGGGRDEARAAGVRIGRPIMIAFAVSGGLAALAGTLGAVRSGSVDPTSFEALLLSAVAAALVGGISLYGGRGSIIGLAMGVLTLQFLTAGFDLRGAADWEKDLATGFVMLTFLLIDLTGRTSPARDAIARRVAARRKQHTRIARQGQVGVEPAVTSELEDV